ncbi:MAG TPA: ABC transporter ATP-binding protein [Longimicrobiales bacterium]|nr:ABC transporter ATP-binding protein [Longimicrobiales bacterium]
MTRRSEAKRARPSRFGSFSLAAWRRTVRRWRDGWRKWARTGIRFLPFLRRRRRDLGWALAFGIGWVLLGVAEPWLLKLILDNVVLDHAVPFEWLGRLPGGRIGLLNLLVFGVVLLAVLRGVFYYRQQLHASRAGQRTAADVRRTIYEHLQHLCFRFHDRRRTGDVLTRLTADVKLLRDIFISLPLSIASELVLIICMVIVMMLMDWSLTLLAFLVMPAIVILLRTYQRPMKQAIRKQRDREGHLATIASEVLGAIRVVQGYRREDYEIDRFGSQNQQSLRSGLKAARLEAKLRWFAEVAVAVVTAAVLSVATRRVLNGTLSPGELLVFVTYLRTFNRPMRRISRMAERAARGAASGDRIMDILEARPTVTNQPGARRARTFRGEIRFDEVWFEHRRRRPVLRGIDLEIAPGEKVAIVGPTGSGKSTLINLIPRFYDVTSGSVRIDGHDVREYTLASLRDQISLVFQEPVLFAASIAENIGYGKADATSGEIVEAAERAGIHDHIAALPDGYDTMLGERGGTLSGGQRQCVAIARAMIRSSPIVLLDEPTTGLDVRSTDIVVSALRRLMDGRTVIIITHDIANVRDADRIVVIDAGAIADSGTHAELLSRDGVYRAFHRLDMQAAS